MPHDKITENCEQKSEDTESCLECMSRMNGYSFGCEGKTDEEFVSQNPKNILEDVELEGSSISLAALSDTEFLPGQISWPPSPRKGSLSVSPAVFEPTTLEDKEGTFVLSLPGKQRTNITSSRGEEKCTHNWVEPAFFSNQSPGFLSKQNYDMLDQVGQALSKGLLPMSLTEGESGAYLMKHPLNGFVAVFKPEEDISRRSCHNSFCETVNSDDGTETDINFALRGLRYDEGAVREVVAFLLDRDSFIGVPETLMVRISSDAFSCSQRQEIIQSFRANAQESRASLGATRRSASLIVDCVENLVPQADENEDTVSHFQNKMLLGKQSRWIYGSLQKFVPHDYDAHDIGASLLADDMVHRLGLFDVRVLNTDRHEGNILVKFQVPNDFSSDVTLIPIDHALILPDYRDIAIEGNFCWMNWPQAKKPFNSAAKEYVRNLDAEADARMLIRCLGNKISLSGLTSLKIGTLLLKLSVLEFNLTLYEIGSFIIGDNVQNRVSLEESCKKDSPFLLVMKSIETTNSRVSEATMLEQLENNLREALRDFSARLPNKSAALLSRC